jgi:membrane associated rhomboid family serine protease
VFPFKDNIPTRDFPVITVAIVAINVVVFFILQQPSISLSGATVDPQITIDWGLIPFEVTHPGEGCALVNQGTGIACGPGAPEQPSTWLTILTSMFMHGGLLHLGGNMLFLWVFGNNIEDSMGKVRFVIFYLLGGAVAGFAQVLIGPNEAIPTIGASGAVAAVLGGYALLYPRARVVTLIFIIIIFTVVELPALLVLGLWFLLQLFYAGAEPVSGGGGGVAYFAHIGGFLFGLAVIKLFANRVHEDYDQARRLPVY